MESKEDNRVERATVEMTRDEAYAALAAISHALIGDMPMPCDMEKSLYMAIKKLRDAFHFEPGDVS